MSKITEAEFDALWMSTTTRIFRVEQYASYFVPSDHVMFERHVAGTSVRSSELHPEWYSRIARKVQKGIRVDRLRVFDLPIPAYQQYEIDWGYAIGMRYGQATWAIRRNHYESLIEELGILRRDYWLFDDTPILIEYTAGIDYIGETTITSERLKKDLNEAAGHLLKRSMALGDFCEANGISIDTSRIEWDVVPPDVNPIL